ncbi:MAG: FmdE family protein [Peptococcaceae bacterium]|jgi:formylmethanofuran dehydrogenase subunit E|nr:FmdE family protein [Peptococcaceae bacterium]MDH7525835.1 FmdE family protein [Peptococcaceae bacterium]
MSRQTTAWGKAVEFHGHECPGLAIGVRAVEAAKAKMGITFSQDEEIVCVTENDACGVDAVQVLTGCSLGKGNLIYRGTGKQAFTFFKRKTGEGLRIVLKPFQEEMDREKRQEYILQAKLEDLFEFKRPHFSLPQTARLFATQVCEKCGEGIPEHKTRIQDGKKVCLDCFHDYSRGW